MGIFLFGMLQTLKLDEAEVREVERLIYASRNIMNAMKNFKGIRHNMDDFDSSDNAYLNGQYKLFSKRLAELYLLYTQSCRMQIYAMKDLLLSHEHANNFDRPWI